MAYLTVFMLYLLPGAAIIPSGGWIACFIINDSFIHNRRQGFQPLPGLGNSKIQQQLLFIPNSG